MALIILCITIVEWVQMTTQIITVIITIIMAYLAYRTFLITPKQNSDIEKTELNNKNIDDLIVFETSKQRTRLIIDSQKNKINCFLLDKNRKNETLQWTIEKEEAAKIINSSNIYINPNYKPNTGTFSIGQKRHWLYSKNLFPEPDYLKGEIVDLIKKII